MNNFQPVIFFVFSLARMFHGLHVLNRTRTSLINCLIGKSGLKHCFSFISALFLEDLAKISFNRKMTQLVYSPWFNNF